MRLFIDIGNTATKIATFENEKMSIFAVVDTEKILKGEITLESIFPTNLISNIEDAYVSSVVPVVAHMINDHFELLNKEIDFVHPWDDSGVKINIDNPKELGADLLCDLAAGYHLFGSPLLIIDLGTVTKFLFIDDKGVFSTCSFLPGLELTFRTLGQNTALLPKVEMGNIKPLLDNHNTVDVIMSSTYYSHIDMLNGMVKRYRDALNYPFKIILSGGNANKIKDTNELNFEYEYVDNLCLLGIKIISERKK